MLGVIAIIFALDNLLECITLHSLNCGNTVTSNSYDINTVPSKIYPPFKPLERKRILNLNDKLITLGIIYLIDFNSNNCWSS